MEGTNRLKSVKGLAEALKKSLAYYPMTFYVGVVFVALAGIFTWLFFKYNYTLSFSSFYYWINSHSTTLIIIAALLLGVVLMASGMAYKQVSKLSQQDYLIWLQQRSTRTLFPFFVPIHDWLRLRITVYRWWHTKTFASPIHTVILIVFVIFITKNVVNNTFPRTILSPEGTGSYYYAGGYQTAWSTSNPTSYLNDNSPGDTVTSPTATFPQSYFYNNASPADITGYQFTYSFTTCSGVVVGGSKSFILEGSWDTSTWASINSGTLSSSGTYTNSSITGTYRYFRLSVQDTTCNGIRLGSVSDWRNTVTTPASKYWWTGNSYKSAWSTSTPTPKLNDASPGDTTTYVGDANPELTAFYDNGSQATLTDYQFTTISLTCNNSGFYFEGSNNTSNWTMIDSGVNDDCTNGYGTHTLSSLSSSFRYYRLSITDLFSQPAGEYLGDWRMTFDAVPAADHLVVTGTSPVNAGSPFSVTVTAKDSGGSTVTGYTGTVHFTSTDGAATLPSNYTFVGGDNGVHTFTNGVTLHTVGTQTVTATDTITGSITGTSGNITVNAVANSIDFNYTDTFNTSIDSVRWNQASPNLATVSSGRVMAQATSAPTASSGIKSQGIWTMSGNFDIQVDFDNTSQPTPSSERVEAFFQIFDSANNTYSIGNQKLPDGSFSYACWNEPLGVGGSSCGRVDNSTSSGKLRLVRSSSTITAYYWTGSWTLVGTISGASTSEMSVDIYTNNNVTTGVVPLAYFDNFIINSGTVAKAATAGTAFTTEVAVKDASGNIDTSYTGTIHFTSNDSQAILPSNYTFTGGDAGVHTFTNGMTLKTAGTKTLTATDVGNGALTYTENVDVAPASASSISLGYNYNDTFDTSIDSQRWSSSKFVNPGVNTVGVDTGRLKATATGINNNVWSGAGVTSQNFHGDFDIQADYDDSNQPINTQIESELRMYGSSYAYGVQHLSEADGTHNYAGWTTQGATGGTGFTGLVSTTDTSGKMRIARVGSTITIYDWNGSSWNTIGNKTNVDTSDMHLLMFTAIYHNNGVTATAYFDNFTINSGTIYPAFAAGSPFSTTATAYDAYGNIATGYTGTVHFTSSDGQAALPTDYTFVGGDAGVHTLTNGVTLFTSGVQSITATDATHSLTGAWNNITITAGPASTIVLSGITTPIAAGSNSNAIVTARDTYGNIATSYTGTVHFTSSDGQATLPADYTFVGGDAGTHTFTGEVVLKTAGSQTVTSTDTINSALTSTQNVTVTAGSAAQIIMTTVSTATVGTPFSAILLIKDAYNNVATNYVGTVHFTSTDSQATLPSNYTFTGADAGTHSFSSAITLRTSGSKTLTVAEVSPGTLSATATIAVAALPVTNPPVPNLTLTFVPASVTTGLPFSATVVAKDSSGTILTSYTGTVHFTSSDSQATLPASYTYNSGDSGVHVFTNGFALVDVGNSTLTVIDSGNNISAMVTVAVVATGEPLPIPGTVTSPPSVTPPTTTSPTTPGRIAVYNSQPNLQKAADITSVVSSAVAIASFAPAASAATTILTTSVLQGASIFNLPFLGLARRRKKKKWGVVENKLTGLPLAGVFVELWNLDNPELLGKTMTDTSGQFAFLVSEPGRFYLRVDNPLYDAYHSLTITITDPRTEIVKAEILLMPIESILQNRLHRAQKLIKITEFLYYLNWPLLIIGTFLTALTLYNKVTIFGVVMAVIYGGMWLMKILEARYDRPFGVVTDIYNESPQPLSVVQLTKQRTDGPEIVRSTITDSRGRFLFVVKKSKYSLTAAKNGYDPSEKVISGEDINIDVKLKKNQPDTESSTF